MHVGWPETNRVLDTRESIEDDRTVTSLDVEQAVDGTHDGSAPKQQKPPNSGRCVCSSGYVHGCHFRQLVMSSLFMAMAQFPGPVPSFDQLENLKGGPSFCLRMGHTGSLSRFQVHSL